MTSPTSEYCTRLDYLARAIKSHQSDDCLMWPHSVDKDGYGKLTMRIDGVKRKVSAHRVAFLLVNGKWPEPNGLHHCDTPGCFNPRHVFEGTDADNHADQLAKGRTLKGTKQRTAKLTEEIVAQAREEYLTTNLGFHRLAKKYGVSRPTMKVAIEGITNWTHVPNPVMNIRPPKTLRRTHCRRGHVLNPGTYYSYGNCRQCKECTKIRHAKRKRRLKEVGE